MNSESFTLKTPVGWIALVGGPAGIREIILQADAARLCRQLAGLAEESYGKIVREGRAQIEEYFAGRRWQFRLPIDMGALSPFAVQVLESLQTIPFGSTLTYGELAGLAGYPGAARAVGRVMARNPFPIVIPCHRVLGADGKLTGYSGGEGVASKEWLLRFERNKLIGS